MKQLFKQPLNGVGRAAMGQATNYATRQYVGENKKVDVRLGVALLKDSRVALKSKLMSLGLGIVAILLLDTLEFPLEMLIATLLPFVGLGINLVGDGIEFLVGSLLIAAAALPHLAPKPLVERIRAERNPALVPVHAGR